MYLWYPVIILKASLQISYRTIFLVAEITAKPANLPAKIRGLSRAAVWCTASQSEPQGQNGFHEKFSLWKDVVIVIVIVLKLYYGLFYKFHIWKLHQVTNIGLVDLHHELKNWIKVWGQVPESPTKTPHLKFFSSSFRCPALCMAS